MPIHVQCNNCQRRFRAPDTGLGKTGRCPNCGNRITIQPVDEQLPTITVAPESANQALRKSSSSIALLVTVATVFVFGVAGVIGLLIYRPQPTDSVEVEPVDVDGSADVVAPATPISADEETPRPAEGLGLTLEQFKQDMPIGESWKLFSETIRDDGTVSYQLQSTMWSHIVITVTGNLNDLGEVSIIFALIDHESQSRMDVFLRIAGMVLFLSEYSRWTQDELVLVWGRILNDVAEGELKITVQKNGKKFWIVPIGAQDGVVITSGISAEPNSTAPTLQEWLDAHPLPVAAGLPLTVGLNESTVKAGKVTNGRFSFKGFRHKGRDLTPLLVPA